MNTSQKKSYKNVLKGIVGRLTTILGYNNSGNTYIKRGGVNGIGGEIYTSMLIDLYEGSSTLAKCIDIKTKFIKGKGFAVFNKNAVNNSGLSLYDLLTASAHSLNLFGCYVWRISYNADSSLQITPMPADRWAYTNKNFNEVLFFSDDNSTAEIDSKRIFPLFESFDKTKERHFELMQKGQGWIDLEEIYIGFHKKDLTSIYPTASYHSVIYDALSEVSVKKSRFRDARSGFTPKIAAIFYENVADDDNERLTSLTNEFSNVLGDEAGQIIVQIVPNKESKPDFERLQVDNPDKMYEYTEQRSEKNIRTFFQIPDILFGNSTAGKLGDTQEFENAVSYMQNHVVNEDQMLLKQSLDLFLPKIKIFADWDKNATFEKISL